MDLPEQRPPAGGEGLEAGHAPSPPASPESGPPAATPPAAGRGWKLSLTLLLLTFGTTLLSGVAFEAGARGLDDLSLLGIASNPGVLAIGLPYAISLLAILGTHEMGHYLACRRYGIDATPPYFLPSPPGLLFGTFGAFIRIRAPITDRRALFDIGVAGPLAGFVVAVPVLVWGVLTSQWQPELPEAGGLYLGDCVATRILSGWVLDPAPEPQGWVLAFGSVAMAGWVGMLATALNLLPIGQLDGGHIAYAVSPALHRWTSRLCLALFCGLGLAVNESWLFWATVLILLSPRHPLLLDESSPLPRSRLAVALVAAAVFALAFIPDPLRAIP